MLFFFFFCLPYTFRTWTLNVLYFIALSNSYNQSFCPRTAIHFLVTGYWLVPPCFSCLYHALYLLNYPSLPPIVFICHFLVFSNISFIIHIILKTASFLGILGRITFLSFQVFFFSVRKLSNIFCQEIRHYIAVKQYFLCFWGHFPLP